MGAVLSVVWAVAQAIGVAMAIALLAIVGLLCLTVSLAALVEAYRAVRLVVLRRRMRAFLRDARS